MRFKVKCVSSGDLNEGPVPETLIAAQDNIAPGVIGKGKGSALKCPGNDRNLVGIEAHEIRASSVDAGRMHSKQNNSRRHWIGIQWSPALACENAVDEHEVALAILRLRRTQRAIGIAEENNLVEVEAHAPNGVVAKPVSAADRGAGIAKNWLAGVARYTMQPRSDHRYPHRKTAKRRGNLAFGPVLEIRVGVFVATSERRAFRVVREPIFVCIDSNQILEARSDAGFFVGLPFRQTEDHVALDGTACDEIFVLPSAVVTIDNACVIIRSVIITGAAMIDEFTCLT